MRTERVERVARLRLSSEEVRKILFEHLQRSAWRGAAPPARLEDLKINNLGCFSGADLEWLEPEIAVRSQPG